jgi:hypothetical protein
MYIPFEFVFEDYFCIIQTLIEFTLKTINFIITMITHIDRLIRYPTDPYWNTKARALLTENLNLLGEMTNWAPIFVANDRQRYFV